MRHLLPFRVPFPLLFFWAGGSSAATIAYHMSVHDLSTFRNRSTDPSYLVKHILQLILSQSRTFHIFDCTQLFGHPLSIVSLHRLHPLLGKLIFDRRILPEVDLGTNNETWDAGTVMMDFWKPLFANVFERCRGCDGETDEKDVRLRIG